MTPPPVYLGLDVAKATLACHLAGSGFSLPNDAKGHAALVARLRAHGAPVHAVAEATGGYERPVVAALCQAGLPVSVLHPARARQLACGLGYLAKTDAIAAAALAAIGALPAPAPHTPASESQARLAALVNRREQLAELLRREAAARESTLDKLLLRDLDQSLAALRKRQEKIAALIAAHLAADAALGARAERLQQAPGIGPVAAATLLAFLPELGQGSAARLTSLAGLAPHACDSGAFRGARHVHGGRPKVRRILYLCALSASRYHPHLKLFHARLIAAGKAPKLALVAVARKLLTYLHSALKNPQFSLA